MSRVVLAAPTTEMQLGALLATSSSFRPFFPSTPFTRLALCYFSLSLSYRTRLPPLRYADRISISSIVRRVLPCTTTREFHLGSRSSTILQQFTGNTLKRMKVLYNLTVVMGLKAASTKFNVPKSEVDSPISFLLSTFFPHENVSITICGFFYIYINVMLQYILETVGGCITKNKVINLNR